MRAFSVRECGGAPARTPPEPPGASERYRGQRTDPRNDGVRDAGVVDGQSALSSQQTGRAAYQRASRVRECGVAPARTPPQLLGADVRHRGSRTDPRNDGVRDAVVVDGQSAFSNLQKFDSKVTVLRCGVKLATSSCILGYPARFRVLTINLFFLTIRW